LEGHQDLQHLIHDVCRAIDQEQVNLFIEEAPELLEKINLHFSQEEALFKELPPEALNIREYTSLNIKMHDIEKELVGVEMYA
jgi:4'-phosphopantetheinyl transferase EntD